MKHTTLFQIDPSSMSPHPKKGNLSRNARCYSKSIQVKYKPPSKKIQFIINNIRGVKLLALEAFQCGPRDDSEITNEFWQYCNWSLSNKRLKHWSQATLERYKFLSFGGKFTDAGKVITFYFGDRSYFGLHYRDRCPEKWWSPNPKPHAALGTIAHICKVAPSSPRVWHPWTTLRYRISTLVKYKLHLGKCNLSWNARHYYILILVKYKSPTRKFSFSWNTRVYCIFILVKNKPPIKKFQFIMKCTSLLHIDPSQL